MAWTYVFLAGIVEVFWVIGLRYSSTMWHWVGTVIMIILSFYLIIKACDRLPSGTVYAVFTGMGATGIVLVDFLIFQSELSLIEFCFIALIVIGVIGLKITTPSKEELMDKTPDEVHN
jgi:paired small multidrug resistance pump